MEVRANKNSEETKLTQRLGDSVVINNSTEEVDGRLSPNNVMTNQN